MRLLNIVQEILDEKYISKGNLMIEPEAGMRIEIKGEDFLCYKFGVDVHKEFLNHFSDHLRQPLFDQIEVFCISMPGIPCRSYLKKEIHFLFL